MIPRASITAWRSIAPWPSNEQVEQDLVVSRSLVAIFQNEAVAERAVFRGGTALHKLFLGSPGRYSEGIDLVQRDPGPIGTLVNGIREALDPWLGNPRWKQTRARFTLQYRFETAFEPVSMIRLKIEINTREHFNVLGIRRRVFAVENPWFQGWAAIPVYEIEELLGTKMRALYQRKKGRDLYDLWLALEATDGDLDRIVECFARYMDQDGAAVSRAESEANLKRKLEDRVFLDDMRFLVPADIEYDPHVAARIIQGALIARLPGKPRKGTSESG